MFATVAHEVHEFATDDEFAGPPTIGGVFTRPEGLDEAVLVERLMSGWALDIERIEHQPVGFGSHHWLAHGRDHSWFVTVDDLDAHLRDESDDRSSARVRLDAALGTASGLREAGRDWVVAPLPTRDRTRVTDDLDDRFVCAVYPVVDGSASPSGDYADPDERRAVVSLLADLHRADPERTLPAVDDDHVVPHHDALRSAMDDVGTPWATGPFAESTRRLLAKHRAVVARVLDIHDDLAATLRRRCPSVVTHGEPHRANVIVTTSRC